MPVRMMDFTATRKGGFSSGLFSGRTVGLALWATMVLSAGTAWGISVADDPDNHVVSPGSEYDMVGYIRQDRTATDADATGVLIGPRYVLTAKHVVNHSTWGPVSLILHLPEGDATYVASQTYMHPSIDLALLILAESTGLPGFRLYEDDDEQSDNAFLVGYGVSGTGITGWDDTNYPRGIKRVAENTINWVATSTLKYDFDAPPGGLGASREGHLAPGDSGGALLLSDGGELLLAGIHSTVEPTPAGGFYGEKGVDIRISNYVDWIHGNVLGDANMDGYVDVLDMVIVAGNWHHGTPGNPATWGMGNFNADYIVDIDDLRILARSWSGPPPLEGLPLSVPEPGALALIAGGGPFALMRRRRR